MNRTEIQTCVFHKHDSQPKKKCYLVLADVLSLSKLSTLSHNENFVLVRTSEAVVALRKLSRSVHVFAVESSVRSLANSVISCPTREVLFRTTLTKKAFRVLGKRFYDDQMSRPRLINLHDRSL